MRATIIDVDRTSGPRVRWGAIFAGAVWGLAVMAVLTSLWLALAYPSEIDFVRDNLEWFIAGSGALPDGGQRLPQFQIGPARRSGAVLDETHLAIRKRARA